MSATGSSLGEEKESSGQSSLGETIALAFPRHQLRARTARGLVVNALFMSSAEGLVVLRA